MTFAVVLVGVTAYSLLQSLVLPVLPTIQHALHTSQGAVTWVLTAYLLSASIFTPILGRFGDMFGKERMFVAALAALGLGSLLAALANSIELMIVARAIQGIGGGVLPLAFGIIRDEFPRDKVAGAVGTTAALTAVGGGMGIILAGPIVKVLDFHWLFWLPMAMVLFAAVAAQRFIPPSPVRTPGRISWLAAVLLSVWLVALLVAVSEGPTWGWVSVRVLGLLGLAVVVGFSWVRFELHSQAPLIDMRMMRMPAVWTTNLVAMLFGFGMYAAFAFLPEFVQTPASAGYGFGASVTKSGLFLLPLTVLMFATGLISGRIARRVGSKLALCAGASVSVFAFVLLTVAAKAQWDIYLAMAILGTGFGLAFSAMSNVIVEAVPRSQTGVASGMNANIRTIGGSIGAAIMSSIITSGVAVGALPKSSGYSHGFAVLAGATLLAAVASYLIPNQSRREKLALQAQSELDAILPPDLPATVPSEAN